MDFKIQNQPSRTLDSLSRSGNLRTIPATNYGSRLYLEYKGRELLNLASNNYLGLSGSESLKNAAVLATRRYGTSSSGSRLISGNYQIHDQLEKLLAEFKNQQKALLTGSGYAANLCILGALAGRNTTVFSDRLNHATGILGQGRGLAHHLGLGNEIQVHMGTFSKALGSYGGYIASNSDIIDLIINRGRPFIYSTALPPAIAGASLAALEIIMHKPDKGGALLKVAGEIRSLLQKLGFDTGQSSTQIIPVILGKNSLVLDAREKLIAEGIFTGAIRPPTVPENTARLRLSIRADMGEYEIDRVKKSFALLAEDLNRTLNST